MIVTLYFIECPYSARGYCGLRCEDIKCFIERHSFKKMARKVVQTQEAQSFRLIKLFWPKPSNIFSIELEALMLQGDAS